MKSKKISISDDFWNIKRPNVSNKETFKDIAPIKWNNDNKKVFVYSKKEKNK